MDPKYVIKFVSELEHARDLQAGKLYMRPASYYRSLELGQGDVREGAVSHAISIYSHDRWAIYCLYAVDDSKVLSDGIATVAVKCIEDFKCKDGYAVVIEFDKFERALKSLDTDGWRLVGGRVSYHKITWEDTVKLLTDDSSRNLLVKHPYFAHQKEFRLIIKHEVEQEQDHVEYYMAQDLKAFSHIVSLSSVVKNDEVYFIPLGSRT